MIKMATYQLNCTEKLNDDYVLFLKSSKSNDYQILTNINDNSFFFTQEKMTEIESNISNLKCIDYCNFDSGGHIKIYEINNSNEDFKNIKLNIVNMNMNIKNLCEFCFEHINNCFEKRGNINTEFYYYTLNKFFDSEKHTHNIYRYRKYTSKESKKKLINEIINIAKEVFFRLQKYCYSERIFQNAMELEFRNRGIFYETEAICNVEYKGCNIGFDRCDLIVEKCIIVELKSISKTFFKESDKEVMQLRRYLRDMKLSDGIVINFPIQYENDGIVKYVIS